ncbi:MAG: T3SS (YopN, CesT) and YbjN peptide-binding chaperone 1, partial [Candidatus Kapaibacterium sp.]
AHVVSEADVSPELMKFLLRKNAELHIGGFGLLFDDTVVFSYAVTGTHLDRNELVTAIAAVAIIADHYDDEIVALAGGKRASDITEL